MVFKIQKVLLYVWPQQKILFKVPQVQKFLLEMVGLGSGQFSDGRVDQGIWVVRVAEM